MKLRLERQTCGLICTVGSLYIDDTFECYTLEDRVREDGRPVNAWKIDKQTAIPTGTYNVVITPSTRFKRDLPLLENVPGFSGIRIHYGNTAEDTEGCILVGQQCTNTGVFQSRVAFGKLFDQIKAALASGETVEMGVG